MMAPTARTDSRCRKRPVLRFAGFVAVGLAGICLSACSKGPKKDTDGIYHVRPGQSIQHALDAAARESGRKTVRVHAGVYRPTQPGQAFIWLNHRHDGITLEASGEVILTAANKDVADPKAESFPAIVNHVVYFGDGISARTTMRGFKITGANHFVTKSNTPGPIQPKTGIRSLDFHDHWQKELFYYSDGGAIKIYGRSYPTIENVEIYDNYASPCAGGISIEHRGFFQGQPTLRNCRFRNNRSQITGAAVDVLPGSAVLVENCLFVGNVSNTGTDSVGTPDGPYNAKHGSGALTVFPDSYAKVIHCTFTDNWNGVDDKGRGNVYRNCIFWKNTRKGGKRPGGRFELDIVDGHNVSGCFLKGEIDDVRGTIDKGKNTLDAPDPRFDDEYRPQAKAYANAGFRPKKQ